MIEHPMALAAVLVTVVIAVVVASKTRSLSGFFKFLPVPFYCYFIPIIGATAGLFPGKSPVYDFLGRHVLPPCLILLLLGSPWNEMARLGRHALVAMAAGTAGMFAGAVFGFLAAHRWLPGEFWMAAGSLLGSWVGGSANMMAVKEALSMPDALLAPLIVVDTIVAYSWMALLIALAGRQARFDARLRAADIVLPERAADSANASGASRVSIRVFMLIFAVFVGELCLLAGGPVSGKLPQLQLSAKAWAVVLATTAGLALSLTPARRLESYGASNFGMTILLMLLASYGAQSNLGAILKSPAFMLFGVVMIVTHGTVLLACGYFFRIPLFYLATASQACVGGPVSAPIVAGVYRPALTHVGVILALIGGAAGTYVGIFGAMVCRWIG